MTALPAIDRLEIQRTARAGFVIGAGFVVAGGLVAAITAPLALANGSWLAAYLVLVCGVAQCMLAVQDNALGATDASAVRLRTSLVGWNAGNVLVVVGVLTATPIVVDLGGILLLAVLIAAAVATRSHSAPVRAALYRVGLGILIVSIPIGLMLAHLRAAG